MANQALTRPHEAERPAALVTLGSGLYGLIAVAALVVLPSWDRPFVLGAPLS